MQSWPLTLGSWKPSAQPWLRTWCTRKAEPDDALKVPTPTSRRSPHDLRHTDVTLALKRGVPVKVVSKIVGHASVSITLDTYRHVFENEKRAQVVDLLDTMPSRWKAEAVVAALN